MMFIRNCLLLLLALYLTGCASMQPLSNYARSGDTVLISLGGTHSNALVSVLKKGNIAVSITDSNSTLHTVKLRSVFRVYSDPTSGYDFRSPNNIGYYDSYVAPHQGLWMAVVDLIDPVTDNPVPLATGSATISISSPDLDNWFDHTGYGWSWTNGNLNSIGIEILAGTGAPNPLNYLGPVTTAPLDSLAPNPHLEISTSGTPSDFVGGASFVLQYDNADFGGLASQYLPRAVKLSPDANVQIASHHVHQDDGTTLLTVIVSNPHGFNTNNNKQGISQGRSLLRSLGFNLVWDDKISPTGINDSNWQSHFTLLSSKYIDLQGDALVGLSAVMAKAN